MAKPKDRQLSADTASAGQNAHGILERLLAEKIAMTEGGETIEVPAMYALMLRLHNASLAGDHRATRVWGKYRKLLPPPPQDELRLIFADTLSAMASPHDTV